MKNRILVFGSILLLMVPLFSSMAQGMGSKGSPDKSVLLQQSYVWYDGNQERQIWLDSSLVAEFNGKSLDQSSIKNAISDAMEIPSHQPAVRLWKIGGSLSSEAVSRNLNQTQPDGKHSPVLRDGPNTSNHMRALPGNIIVYLNPKWDPAMVTNWLNQHKLVVVKKIEVGPNIYLIKTGPGLIALETANALYKSGEVVAAFPDWWEEATPR